MHEACICKETAEDAGAPGGSFPGGTGQSEDRA